MELLKILSIALLSIYIIRQDIFISKVKLKAGLKGIEFEMDAKEKNGPSSKNDRSNQEKK